LPEHWSDRVYGPVTSSSSGVSARLQSGEVWSRVKTIRAAFPGPLSSSSATRLTSGSNRIRKGLKAFEDIVAVIVCPAWPWKKKMSK
jgi:hypothetical protein